MKLEMAKDRYKSLVDEIAKASSSTPKTFDELTAKAKNFEASLEKLNKTGAEMSSIQHKQLEVLKQVSAQLNSMSSLGKLNTLMEQFTKNVQAASDVLGRLASTSGQAAATQQGAAQATQEATATMAQASQQLGQAEVNYERLTKSIIEYNSEVKEVSAANARHRVELDSVSSSMKKVEKSFKSGDISLDAYSKRMGELKLKYDQLKAAMQQNNALIRNHSTAIVSTSGSYNEMNAAMLMLQKRFKDLNEAERNSPMGQNLLKQADALNTKLKEIDAKFGNYQRNVGNYASGWNGLNMSVQQLVRELPSATMGLNMFFLAISNNLPILTDEIKRAKAANVELKKSGQSGVPVWKQLVSSLFSWQSAMMVGITVLTMYGKDIMEWVGGLFKAKESTDALKESQDTLNAVQRDGDKNAQDEIVRLKLLYNATQDTARSMGERNKAVDELQKQYPNYFGNLSRESVLAGDAANAYAVLSKSIVASARARAAQDKMVENANEILSLEEKMAAATAKREQAQEKANLATSRYNELAHQITEDMGYLEKSAAEAANRPLKDSMDAANARVSALNNEIDGYTKSIERLETLNETLAGSIDINALLSGDGEGNAGDYATYIKKITEDLNKSRIDLMREGRDKEIAEINADYQARMDAITGDTQKEVELRANLEQLKQAAIREVDEKYNRAREEVEKENLENRLAALSAGSQEELDERLRLQLELNGMMRDAEVAEAEKSGADVAAVTAKYEKLKNGIVLRNLEERMGLMERETDDEIRQQELGALKEANALKKQYADGEINREEYERGMNEITLKYSKMRLQAMMDEARAELELAGLTDEQRKDLETRIDELQAKMDGLGLDAELDKAKDKGKEFADAMRLVEQSMNESLGESANLLTGTIDLFKELTKEGEKSAVAIGAAVMQIANGLNSVMNDIYQGRIDALEEEQEANEEAYDKEVERIEALQEQGAISEEEAEARKRAAEDKTRLKEEEIARKKAQLEQKQAKWDKANSIVQATIATSLAVAKALPNLVLAAVVGAMGAAQVAMIAAQSVPKYARGTDDHPGGLAIVGDAGKHEGIVTERGVYVSPDKPTLVELPKHARVIPDLDGITSLEGLRSDYGLLEKILAGRQGGVMVNVENDLDPLERRLDENTRQLKNIRRLMRKSALRRDFARISTRI